MNAFYNQRYGIRSNTFAWSRNKSVPSAFLAHGPANIQSYSISCFWKPFAQVKSLCRILPDRSTMAVPTASAPGWDHRTEAVCFDIPWITLSLWPRPVRVWSNRTSWLTVSCFLRNFNIYDIMAIFKRDSISLETSAILWDYTRKTKTTLLRYANPIPAMLVRQKSAHHRRCIHPPTRGFESLERGQHSLPQWSTYSSSNR